MKIARRMDLAELATHMGTAADRADAVIMREMLNETNYKDTADIPAEDWNELLLRVADTRRFDN